ncbi:glycosyltransferase [Ureibacillus endophyticus]|uniref:Glycosyltransferase n=1 Tax=Ureibacillus endophyticus TaxID=1978490 RepID=A0A494YZ14_9BACL|nr:glycosyltransferase [Lysinibacillus endophyticus]RKQ15436.1 glycosyltransferase [Lysinibacillus endophyticus]
MTKKKKIIIVSNNLASGGIQKALVNLLNEIKDKYEIALFLFSDSGNYSEEIPKKVNVIHANSFLKLLAISQKESKKEGLFYYLLRAILVLWTKLINNEIPMKILFLTQRKLKKFDVAISFVQSPNEKSFYGGCNEFVLNKIESTSKIAFIHCDFLNYGGNTHKNRNLYLKFNSIAAVSESCKNNFIEAIPELTQKTYCIRNCHDYECIKENANQFPVEYNTRYFNIVTVARLSEEKGLIRALEIINRLIKRGYKITWQIIGDGRQRKEIEQKIQDYLLGEFVILHGDQKNPYRFMKNADIFFLPSYHEAAPMVLDEARALALPVLTTNTLSAIEMVESNNCGWVCENSITGIEESLIDLLNNQNALLKIKNNLMTQHFTNEVALKQFDFLLNGATNNVK